MNQGLISLPTSESLDDYGLGGVNCPICNNTGLTKRIDENGFLYSSECECMPKRRSMKYIRNSGLQELFNRYTFDSYKTDDNEKRKTIKERAIKYANAKTRAWWFIGGKSGSGKTHICTAICKTLLDRGIEVRYIVWRDFAREMKAIVNDDSYSERLNRLKNVKVLYIDDLFKGKYTEADINLAFELINARYNGIGRTLISSEFTINQICDIDEAIGGRIKEMSKGYQGGSPDENYRLR